ncbi:MAG: Maf family nucleotide pyrophosphatase [Rickettsiales bacterium]|jgi:septum formation protein|nr:Maf family nucleotide pyrophosphatase [Rickettsiales bacterium]
MANFILASGSESRLRLLKQIYCTPDEVVLANIDETPLRREKPEIYVKRMAKSKAEGVAREYKNKNILAADSIIVANRQIIQKPRNSEETEIFLNLYSGKNIKSLTAVYLIKQDGSHSEKLVETKLKFKHFNQRDISDCKKYNHAENRAGGINIEGFIECMIKSIHGSYSNIVGLPLYEVRNMLISANILV